MIGSIRCRDHDEIFRGFERIELLKKLRDFLGFIRIDIIRAG